MDVQAAMEASTLFGWPIESIDKLRALRQQANEGLLPIAEWRSQDKALRERLPALSEDEQKLLDQLSIDIITTRAYRNEGGELLLSRLHAIEHPAPDNAKLREELTQLATLAQKHPEDQEVLGRERARIVGWLLGDSNEGDRDPLTMLPWSYIARFRTVDDPVLGLVPQPLTTARKLAIEQATAEQRADAQAVGGQRVEPLAEASAGLTLHSLTRFPKLVLEGAASNNEVREPAQTVRALWASPAIQQLLRQETSDGWPPEFH
ncbi:hypothetical protein ABTW72_17595 [Micromonospora sp. NPDC127501]|uniref:hypothetical protein n=1 Tax=Micromonospora sp. NPDC127501 TaxID=3154872 RepID=UPI00332B0505